MFCEPSPALYRYIYYIYSGQKEIRKFLKTLFNFRPGLFFDQMSEGGLDRLSVSRINNFLLFYVVTAVSVPLWLGSTQLNEINPKKWRLEDIFYTKSVWLYNEGWEPYKYHHNTSSREKYWALISKDHTSNGALAWTRETVELFLPQYQLFTSD